MLSKRIAFIWTRIPPYAVACLSCLKKEIGENLFIGSFGEPPIHVTNEMLSNLGDVKSYKYHNNNKSDYNKIIYDLELFNPDVLIVTGWSFKTLRKVSQYFKNKNKITVSMIDTPWKGSLKQIGKSFFGKIYLKKSFSKVWVPGVQSNFLMKYTGYNENSIWKYLYCCDTNIYTPSKFEKKSDYFVFVGRLEKEKNIHGLNEGFKEFYKNNPNYKLIVIGDGSERSIIEGTKGVECLGWKTSKEIIRYLQNSNGFVLPSDYEPWGVVVHEAASCGIPLILSDAVGSRHEFLINNFNGKLFNPNDKYDLANAMSFVKENNVKNIMGNRSYQIAQNLNIKSWTKNLLMNVKASIQ